MDKVINPKSGKAVTIGGRVYNELIDQGYTLVDGQLTKSNKKIQKQPVQQVYEETKRPQFYEYDNTIEYYPLPNVRCIECNLPILKYNRYRELLQEGYEPIEVYDMLGIKRVCCRKEYGFPHMEPFPYIDEDLIRDEPPKMLSKNPKLTKAKPSNIIRLYENDKLIGLKERHITDVDDLDIEYLSINPRQLKRTPIKEGKYYISSAK